MRTRGWRRAAFTCRWARESPTGATTAIGCYGTVTNTSRDSPMVEIEDDIMSNTFWNAQNLTSPLDHQLAHTGKATCILAHQNGRLGDFSRARAEVIITNQAPGASRRFLRRAPVRCQSRNGGPTTGAQHGAGGWF